MFAYVSSALQRVPRVANLAVKGAESGSLVRGRVSSSKRLALSRKFHRNSETTQQYVRIDFLSVSVCFVDHCSRLELDIVSSPVLAVFCFSLGSSSCHVCSFLVSCPYVPRFGVLEVDVILFCRVSALVPLSSPLTSPMCLCPCLCCCYVMLGVLHVCILRLRLQWRFR